MKKNDILITTDSIKDLGFRYICGDLETNSDLTFNMRKSNGLYICLVFQPSDNEITLSSHTEDVARSIQRLHQSKMTKISQLKRVLQKLLIIK